MSSRAVRFSQPGGPEVLRIEQVEDLSPGPGEVAIAVRAAGVNPADLAFIAGGYGVRPNLPATPGWEAAGTIVETGAGVDPSRIGERVIVALGATGDQGAWRDRVVVDTDFVFPTPNRLTDARAGSALIPYLTAEICIGRLAPSLHGDSLLITAAGSAVGMAAGQVARRLGIPTVGVLRREPDAEQAVLLTCDSHLVFAANSDSPFRPEPGTAIGAVLDCVAGDIGAAAFRVMRSGGIQIVPGRLGGLTLPIDANSLIFGEKTVSGFWLNRWLSRSSMDERQAAYQNVLDGLGRGMYVPAIDSEYDLGDVAMAVERAKQPGKRGKVVLRGAGN